MANRNHREALRGAEEETFDILAQVMTSEQWRVLLKAPLARAARLGKRDIAQKLVGAGAEIGTALHAAALGGHAEIVNDLLETGASVAAKDSTNGRTSLHFAAQEGKTEVVQLLLFKGANKHAFDDKQWTPLYVAASYDKVGAALALLAAGADVNLRCGGYEESVLHAAARHGNFGILRAAIERGADVDAVDSIKRTPMHVAATYHKAQAIDVLVEAGANIEARDGHGYSPLLYAAAEPAHEALLALLKHGADANARDKHRFTPLHCVAIMAGEQDAVEMVDSLLRAGADETILDEQGRAAADVICPWVGGAVQLGDNIDRMRELLANAPADRAWRRRGYLVLCRTHPDRANSGLARITGNGAEDLETTPRNDCGGAGEGSPMVDWCGGDWAAVVASVVGLQEEGIFRTIVGYL